MAPLAARFDAEMLKVHNLNHASAAAVLFQRLSVMATGLLLPAAAWRAAARAGGGGGSGGDSGGGSGGSGGGGARTLRAQLLFFLLAANAGLLLVDNVHFQYNGVLMGEECLGDDRNVCDECDQCDVGSWTGLGAPVPACCGHTTSDRPKHKRKQNQHNKPNRPKGLMVWSLLLAAERRFVASGVLFAALLNMKHLFAYMAPAYFVFLLRAYVLGGADGDDGDSDGDGVDGDAGSQEEAAVAAERRKGGSGSRAGGSSSRSSGSGGWWAAVSALPPAAAAARLAALGGAVLAVFAASLGPVIATGQLRALLGRLFPFGRGLCHAYWAPNVWALYSAADKLLAAGLARLGLAPPPPAGHMAGGVVGVARFAALPQVGPKASAAAVLLALAPSLAALWRAPRRRGALAAAAAYANLSGFVWGYHVHEKAVIAVTVPLALLAVGGNSGGGSGADAGGGRGWAEDFLVLAGAGHAALFPLLFGAAEAPAKWIVVAAYYLVAAAGLGRLHGHSSGGGSKSGGGSGSSGGARRSARSGGDGGGDDDDLFGGGSGSSSGWAAVASALPPLANAYVAGLVPLELYCSLGHKLVFGDRLPFAPLMLTSTYCALGVVAVWARMLAWYVRGCPAR